MKTQGGVLQHVATNCKEAVFSPAWRRQDGWLTDLRGVGAAAGPASSGVKGGGHGSTTRGYCDDH
jgi:hypothetical protein